VITLPIADCQLPILGLASRIIEWRKRGIR
jgi:hypothetical protein